jgi:iron complex outermembrane receptor protein
MGAIMGYTRRQTILRSGIVALAATTSLTQVRAQEAQKGLDADEIIVVGRGEAPTDMLTRAPATLIETSNSISLVTSELIVKRSSTDLYEILEGVAGVSRSVNGSRSANNRIVIRGFDSGSAIASPMIRENSLAGGVNYPADPAIYERVEVIKGPAAIQGGAAVPGGYINNVLKSPFAETQGVVNAGVDTFGKVRGSFDFNSPLDASGDVQARIVIAGAAGDEPVDGSTERHISIVPSLAARIGPQTNIRISANIHRGRGKAFWGLPVLATGGTPDVPADFNFDTEGESATINYLGIDAEITHEFLDDLKLTARGGYRDSFNDTTAFYGYNLLPNGNATIYAGRLQRDDRAFTGDLFLTKSFDLSSEPSTITVGVERLQSKNSAKSGYTFVGTDNIFNPQNNFVLPDDFDFGDTVYSDVDIDFKQTGIYAQVILRPLTGLTIMGGVRVDYIDVEGLERIGTLITDVDERKTTSRAGISYAVMPWFNIYASYAESYTPQVFTRTATGLGLEPELADQIEGGFKAELFGRKVFLTGAVFSINRTNVAVPDPVNPRFSIAVGEQRHRGLELELAGDPAPGLTVSAAYTYLDAEVTESTTAGIPVGARARYAPRNQFSFFANYELQEGPLKGLGFGGSAFYRSGIFALPDNTIPFESYTEFDAFLSYRVSEALDFRLAVKNLTDKRFIAGPVARNYNRFGAPRHALLNASLRF